MIQTTAPNARSTKGKASPDSLPSIATTSVTSSEGESDDHMSPRVLFKSSDDDMAKEVVENIQTVIENKNSMVEKKTVGAAAISISSSASTEVAAWNLTASTSNDPRRKQVKPSTTRTISKARVSTVNSSDDDDDEEAIDDSIGAFPTSEMRKLNKKAPLQIPNASKASNFASIPSIMPIKKPSIIVEDPPKSTGSCNRTAMSMTPKQLTEIFNSFDANKTISSMREQYMPQESNDTTNEEASASPTLMAVEAAETVRSTAARWMDGWMPQNESLEREYEALKEVLEDNSNKMLNLREAVETQRALNALKEVEIEDKEKELQAMRHVMEDLVQQKELFVQREQELLETIEELTDKVDDLIEKNCKAKNQSESGLSRKAPDVDGELEPFDEPRARTSFHMEPEPFDEAEDRESCIRRQESLISGLRNTLKAKDKDIYLLKEHMEEALAKIANLELHENDSAAALQAKDADILSLKARFDELHENDSTAELQAKDAEILSLKLRLDVALAGNPEKGPDTEERHDIDSTETAVDIVNSSSFETIDERHDEVNDESEKEEQEETTTSSENEDLQSDADQENTPPSPSSTSPVPPPAPTGRIVELRKKLETKHSESEKPIAPRKVQTGRVLELRRSLEQKGSRPPSLPAPVSACSAEGDEEVPKPSPGPPTPQASPISSEELRRVSASLSKRLDAVSGSRRNSYNNVSCKANRDISTIIVKTQEIGDPRRINFEGECPGTIEVMLQGQHYGNLDARRQLVGGMAPCDEDDKDSCCCWSVAVSADLE